MDEMQHSECRAVVRNRDQTISPVRVRVESTGLEFSARVRDFSITGIGLVATCHVEPGTSIAINRQTAIAWRPKMRLPSQVRHATKLAEGDWLLGCSFSRFLTVDDVEELGR
jgi:hypothetical protein